MKKMKYKVIMLATDNAEAPIRLGVNFHKNIPGKFRGTYFHLYFTSNEEIKVGDYVIPNSLSGYSTATKINTNDTIEFYNEISTLGGFDYIGKIKKIVATTDSSLNLPSIPQSFIEEYVAANGKIEEVEMANDFGKLQPVVANYQNNVIISQPKKTWTRDEVIVLLGGLFYDTLVEAGYSKTAQWESYVLNWIKENLK